MSEIRLDATDIAFFRRKLESVDAVVYEHKFARHKSRELIATQPGVDPDARVYTYGMMDGVGKAKAIGNHADDLPSAEVSGAEYSTMIKEFGASYRFSFSEIRAASKAGIDLDSMRAVRARRALDEIVDSILALGDSSLNLKGLLTLAGTTTHASAGAWGTLATADPDALIEDVLGLVNKTVLATDGAFERYTVVLPQALHQLASSLKLGTASDTTVLKYILATSPNIEAIVPWFRTEYNAANDLFSGKHRICAFPKDVEVVAGLVPREVEFMSPQERNLAMVVNGVVSTGGVVCRHPKAVGFCDVTP